MNLSRGIAQVPFAAGVVFAGSAFARTIPAAPIQYVVIFGEPPFQALAGTPAADGLKAV